MEILGHWISSGDRTRTFYATECCITSASPVRDSHWIPSDEYKTLERAVRVGLDWLNECEEKGTKAHFRVKKVRVYGDGSIRFWDEGNWFATRPYLHYAGYSDEMIGRALASREARLKEVSA